MTKLRTIVLGVVGLYLFVAIANRAAEAAGMRRCDCADTCWCKRPGLSIFRWVTPRNRHHLPGEWVG